MGKLSCAALIVTILLSMFLVFAPVQAVTTVSGSISSNTTWTKSNSPYRLTGPLSIKEGVTLNIEPGATVDFSLYYMQVNGTLHAVGTPENHINIITKESPQGILQQIQFMQPSVSWDSKTGLGSILENIYFEKVSIVSKGCSLRIANNYFDGPYWMAVYAPTGSPQIIGNNITNCLIQGLSVSDSTVISGNYISGSGSTGIYANGNTVVSNNKVTDFGSGIKGSANAVIEGNVVENCKEMGISGTSQSVKIKNNYVGNNQIGINVAGDIENNVITNNVFGLKITGLSTITNNNIVGNSQKSLFLSTASNIDAANNYWGTTDAQAIEQSIWDNKNDFNAGEVTFQPFLTHSISDPPTADFIQITNLAPGDFFYLSFEAKDGIILLAQVAVVLIGVAWLVLGVVLLRRKAKKHSRKLQS